LSNRVVRHDPAADILGSLADRLAYCARDTLSHDIADNRAKRQKEKIP